MTDLELELNELRDRFGSTRLISLAQAAKYVGKDPRTLLSDRTFPVKSNGKRYEVSVIRLARWITQ